MKSIPANALVNVTPNVLNAGGSALDLNGMMLTNSLMAPIGTVQTFSSAAAVGSYFGLASAELARATEYFNGFDNSNKKPGALLFVQYNSAAVAAYLRGGNISALTLAQLQAITGTLIVTVGGYVRTAAALNLSAATSFTSGAAIIQTALNGSPTTQASFTASIGTTVLTVSVLGSGVIAVGQTVLGAGVAAGTIITSLGTGTGGTGTYNVNNSQTVGSEAMTTIPTPVTVAYDSVSGAYVITSGLTGVISTIGFASGTTSAALLLTSATGAVTSQGAAAAVPGSFMDTLVQNTQNWATFMSIFDPDNGSGNTLKLAFSTWNGLQNNRFAYVCWDTDVTPTTVVPATASLGYLLQQANISGTILDYNTVNLAAMVCGAIASIDFTETNGRTTLAYRSQTGLVATVTDRTVADNLKANGYNFYGSYATAAEQFTFIQPGQISGPFEWVDSYIDQIWLNNAFQLALIQLLANAKSIPYNSSGYALIEAALNDPINAGANFGAFRPGVTLSQAQIAEVNNAAGKNIASTLQIRGWYLQVQDASPIVRAARGTPPCTFWYVDGQSVQQINLASIELQ